MTSPESLPTQPHQAFDQVRNAAQYLGENEVLLFSSGSEVAHYHPAVIQVMTQHGQQNLDRLVFDASYNDLQSFEQSTVAQHEMDAPIPPISDPIPQDAQSTLDDLLRVATEQDKFIGIINRPHPSGYSSYFVLLADKDSTVGAEQVITPTQADALPFVQFDLDLHDVYSALRVAHEKLTSATDPLDIAL